VIVRALSIFATSDLSISLGVGDTADIKDEVANKLIEAGLVEAYEENPASYKF
jgi:hypothetical protein